MRQSGFSLVGALAGLWMACGEVKNGNMLADAPPSQGDAAGDAAPAPALVKVTVLTTAGDGQPDPTAKVVFQDGSGALVAEVAVDSAGHAEAMLPGGGNVSAIRVATDTPTALTASITTITGVVPGDDLTIGAKAPGTITTQGGATTMTASFPPNPSSNGYAFYNACGLSTAVAGTASVALSFRDSCTASKFDLVGVASGPNLPTPQFIQLTDVNYLSNGSFTIPGGWSTMATYTVNVKNVPDVVSRMTVTRSSMIENTSVAPTSFDGGDPAAGTVIATVPFPQGFGTRSEINVITGRADASSSQRFDVHTPQLGTSADVDLGTLALPWITGLTLAPNGATWTTVEAGASPDGMLVQWLGRWNDGTRPVTITWRVAQPVAAAGMTLPALPKAYAALDPTQQTVEVTPTRVNWTVVDYEDLAGYDAFRQMADTLVVLDTSSVGAFVGQPYRRHITTQQVPQRLPIPVPGPKQ